MDQDLLATFRQIEAELLRFIQSRISDLAVAEDLLQDLFVKLETHAPEEPVRAHRAFIYRAANNLITDFFRARDRREKKYDRFREETQDDVNLHSPEHIALQREKLVIIQKTIDKLPIKCRKVFSLYCYGELDKLEIAKRLNISTNMVEKHLRKALSLCQKALLEGSNKDG